MAPIWMLLTKYSCQEHHVSAPIPDPLSLTPRGSSAQGEWVASGWRAAASQHQASGTLLGPVLGAWPTQERFWCLLLLSPPCQERRGRVALCFSIPGAFM